MVGFMAAVLTTTSFIPQAIKAIKTKNTKDLSLPMYIIFNSGVFLWFMYGIFTTDLPVTLANGITLIFSMIILIYKIRYK